jgi:putative ABC transport system permease protein
MVLLGLAAVIAVFLSAVGLYGVVSYFVRQRTREIGLRMALGADVRIVTGTVLRQAVAVALAGVAVGLTGALGLTRILRSLLFEVHPNDPLTLAAAAIVLVAVTGFAAWLPARRASRIDPVIALRE